jgi:hypothetical protein
LAVKVTLCPLQMLLPALEEILTAGVTEPEILIAIPFDVALLVVTHAELETSLQVIVVLAASVLVLKLELVAPEIAVLPLYH